MMNDDMVTLHSNRTPLEFSGCGVILVNFNMEISWLTKNWQEYQSKEVHVYQLLL